MANWSLKLLSDPYKDMDIALDDEHYTLGSNDDSDLVLSANTVLSRHIRLQVKDDGIVLSVLDSAQPIYINGAPIEGDTCTLASRDVVTLGTFSFTLGMAGDDLSTVTIPQLQVVEPADTENLASNTVTVLDDAEQFSAEEHDSSASKARSFFARWMATGRAMRWGSLLASGVLVSLAVVIPWLTSGANARIVDAIDAMDSLTPALLVEEMTEQLTLSNLQVNAQRGERPWVIEGYVDNTQQQKVLKVWLSEHYPEFVDNVVVVANLVSGAKATLEALGYGHIAVEADGAGAIVLHGAVQDGKQWIAVVNQLKGDVAGVSQWHDDVQQQVQANTPNMVVKSVSLGRHPFFIGANGQKYFVGSIYGDGYSVERIELSSIYIRQGDDVFQYNLASLH